MCEKPKNFSMRHQMNLEQRREYFLKRLIEQLKTISRYEQNDKYSEKIFKKTEERYRKAQKKFYKMKYKEKLVKNVERFAGRLAIPKEDENIGKKAFTKYSPIG